MAHSLVHLTAKNYAKLPGTQSTCVSMRKANKVIMTMVTLLGNPAKSTSPLTPKNLPKACRTLPEPTESNPTLQQIETHIFTCTAGLRDISTHVPTTAVNDANNSDNDARHHRHHPSIVTDDNSAFTPAFLQQWEAFYTDYLKLAQKYGVSTSSTNADEYAPMPAVSPADDNQDPTPTFHSSLDNLSKEMIHHINSPSASPPPTTTNKDAPHTTIDCASNDMACETICDNTECHDSNSNTKNNERSNADSDHDDRPNDTSNKPHNKNAECDQTDCAGNACGTINHANANQSITSQDNDDNDYNNDERDNNGRDDNDNHKEDPNSDGQGNPGDQRTASSDNDNCAFDHSDHTDNNKDARDNKDHNDDECGLIEPNNANRSIAARNNDDRHTNGRNNDACNDFDHHSNEQGMTNHADARSIVASDRQEWDNDSHARDTRDLDERNNKDDDTPPLVTKPHKKPTNHDLMQPWPERQPDLALCKDEDDDW